MSFLFSPGTSAISFNSNPGISVAVHVLSVLLQRVTMLYSVRRHFSLSALKLSETHPVVVEHRVSHARRFLTNTFFRLACPLNMPMPTYVYDAGRTNVVAVVVVAVVVVMVVAVVVGQPCSSSPCSQSCQPSHTQDVRT